MATRILYPPFREQFASTRYPFVDAASLRTVENKIDMPETTFLDASLHPIGNLGALHLAKIEVRARRVTISIANAQRQVLATAFFDPIDAPANLSLLDDQRRPAGILVSTAAALAQFSAWPLGIHTFLPAATEFVASCVIPSPEIGVRGLVTVNNQLFTGDVWLVGDAGVVLRHEGGGVIRVDVVGDPLFLRQLCEPLSLFQSPGFILTINGCPPDAYGNFQINVGDHANPETILRIFAGNDGLTVSAIGKTIREA